MNKWYKKISENEEEKMRTERWFLLNWCLQINLRLNVVQDLKTKQENSNQFFHESVFWFFVDDNIYQGGTSC